MRKISIILWACVFLSETFAQSQVNNALYIYRNDGKFNAFFYSEIDSITTSKSDELGNVYDEYKSQIVWTQDSVYWIPLEAIDSVSLCKPQNKYSSGVRKMDELLPYITEVNGLSFNLSPTTPANLMPKKGQVLLYESFEDKKFPYGFAGSVSSINNLIINCDSVTLEDVYEDFTCFGEYIAVEEAESSSARKFFVPKKVDVDVNGKYSTAIDISGTLRNDTTSAGLFVTVKGSLALDIRVICRFHKGQLPYIEATCNPHAKIGIESGIKGSLSNKEFYREVFMVPIPIPNSPLMVAITGGPVAKATLEASLTASTEGELGFEFGYKYENGEGHPTGHNTSKNFTPFQITGNIKGSLFAGVHIDVGLYSFFKLIGVSFYQEGGAEVVANLSEDLLNSDKYEELEKAKVDFNLKASQGTKAELKIGNYLKLSKNVNLGSISINLASRKLVPSFSSPLIESSATTKVITSVIPDGQLLWPIPIGLGVCNQDEEFVDTQFCEDSYMLPESWPFEKYVATFDGLIPGSMYEAYPMIKFLGKEIKASPSTPFNTRFPTPAKVKKFEVNNATFVRDGFEYKDKTYYYDFAATTTVELEDGEGVEDWGYVYKDPEGQKVHISVKDLGTNADSRYDYYRTIPKSTATLYGYAKFGEDKYAYEEPKEYKLEYTFHPTAYVGDVIADSITSTSAQFEYGFDDVPRTGKCFTAVQSARDNEPLVREVSYAEKDTVKFAGLFPGTTYEYWAYVEYAGETSTSDKKSLTTLTPTAHVEQANDDKVTMTSAEIGYGFANVPENAKCYVGISAKVQTIAGDGEEINKSYSQTFPVENTTGATYEFNGLYPSTTYTYYAYVEYEGGTWYSDGEKFTTKAPPTPVATTGDCSKVTTNSATVSCSFENVPEGGVCGVEYTWSNGSKKQSIGNANGSQTITLSGLEPGTTYSYCAYVEAYGQTYYGKDMTFTTKYEIPDITGVWHCIEYKDGVQTGEATFELKADGTVTSTTISGSGGYSRNSTGHWSINDEGHVNIQFSWQGFSGGGWKSYGGTINSFVNPTQIEGTANDTYVGNLGGGGSQIYQFVMTR